MSQLYWESQAGAHVASCSLVAACAKKGLKAGNQWVPPGQDSLETASPDDSQVLVQCTGAQQLFLTDLRFPGSTG